MDDLTAARTFYSFALGLGASEEPGPLWLRMDSPRDILVYPKPNHTPATILNLPVADIDQAVDELTARGVTIQRYEGFETDGRGIHRGRDRSIAWFTDPAGNGLSVVELR